MKKSAFFIGTIISFGILSLLLSDALASDTSSNHITLYTHALELKPIPSSFQLAKSTFLPDRFDDLGLSHYNTLDANYNSANCDMFTLSSCPAGSRCETCPFDAKKFRVLSCQDPYILSGGTCVCPTKVSLIYTNDRCTKYCGSTCIAKTCSPSGNQTGCTNGTQSCDNGCGANTRQCCVACAHKVTSKPSYSSYTYSSCYDGTTKQIQTGWKCNSGYHQKDSACEKDCITNNCSGYTLSSCPDNANCTPCTITATNCTTSGTKYKIDSCTDGYMVSGNSCVEKGIRDCAALQAALKNATTGETVFMAADITCDSALNTNIYSTLDGAGHTLTFTNTNAGVSIGNNGIISNLTIKSGSVAAGTLKNVNIYINNTTSSRTNSVKAANIEGTNNFIDEGNMGLYFLYPNKQDGYDLTLKSNAVLNIRTAGGDAIKGSQGSGLVGDMLIEKGATLNIFVNNPTNRSIGINYMSKIDIDGTLNVITESDGDMALKDINNINLSEGANLNITTKGNNSWGISNSRQFTMNLQANSHAQIISEGNYSQNIYAIPGLTIAGTLYLSSSGDGNRILSVPSTSVKTRLTLKESGTLNISALGAASLMDEIDTVAQYGNININASGDSFSGFKADEYYMYGGKTNIHTTTSALQVRNLTMSGGEMDLEASGNSNSGDDGSQILHATNISLSEESKLTIENKNTKFQAILVKFSSLSLEDSAQMDLLDEGEGSAIYSLTGINSSDYYIHLIENSRLNVFNKNNIDTSRIPEMTISNNAQFNIKTSSSFLTEIVYINDNAQFNMICDRERSQGCFNATGYMTKNNFRIAGKGQFNLKTEGADSQCFPSTVITPTSANAKIRLMCNKDHMRQSADTSYITAFPNTVFETSIAKYTGVSGRLVSILPGVKNIEGCDADFSTKLTQMPYEFNKIFSEGIFVQ